jgi:carbamoyl-phosphate synthase large subunit
MVCQIRSSMQLVPELRNGHVYVASAESITSAGAFADKQFVVPRIADDNYISSLQELCERSQVRVLLPIIDVDVMRLAPYAEEFSRRGITVVVPPAEIGRLCLDKTEFEQFAEQHRIRVPRTVSPAAFAGARYPLFFKRRCGFGSIGSGVARTLDEAQIKLANDSDLVFQEFFAISEFSVDAFISHTGSPVYVVQRVRDKVIGGEAVRSHTVKDISIGNTALRLLRALAQRGLSGPVNIQMFASDPPAVFDVNPRLGSASVLSNVATGGRLFASVLQEACGGTAKSASVDDYEEGLFLYRYLGDVFYRTDSSWVQALPPVASHEVRR